MGELVSAVITTYKRSMEILNRAILSVKNQSYDNMELIIVNDYPPYCEEVKRLIANYKDIVLISNEENIGACASRNLGIEAASGTYIAFLDDDDEWFSDKIEKQVLYMKKEDADMVYCTGETVSSDGTCTPMSYICGYGSDLQRHLLTNNYMGGCSVPLIKKSVLIDLGGFDESLPSSQDYDLWIRIAGKYKIAFLNESLIKYNTQDESISTSVDKRIKGYDILYRKHRKLFLANRDETQMFLENIVMMGIQYRRLDVVFNALGKSFAFFPWNFRLLLLPLVSVEKSVARRVKGM